MNIDQLNYLQPGTIVLKSNQQYEYQKGNNYTSPMDVVLFNLHSLVQVQS